jgi:hypothetical protein
MKRLKLLPALALIAGLAVSIGTTSAYAQTTLRVFSGGANQRPDLMRKLFDEYQGQPRVKIRSRLAAPPPSYSGNICHRAQCQGLGHRRLPDRHC